MQQNLPVGNLENNTATPQDWHSITAPSLVEDKALKKDIMEMMSNHKTFGVDVWEISW